MWAEQNYSSSNQGNCNTKQVPLIGLNSFNEPQPNQRCKNVNTDLGSIYSSSI